jgi:hypothetical protein
MTRNDGVWKQDAKKQQEAGKNRLVGGKGAFVTGIPHQIINIIVNIIFFFSARYPTLACLSSDFETCNVLRRAIASPRATSKLKDQVSQFMTPGDRVTKL